MRRVSIVLNHRIDNTWRVNDFIQRVNTLTLFSQRVNTVALFRQGVDTVSITACQ